MKEYFYEKYYQIVEVLNFKNNKVAIAKRKIGDGYVVLENLGLIVFEGNHIQECREYIKKEYKELKKCA
jgi:hypothetical protein